jgi:CheY-like chemotaxis protein
MTLLALLLSTDDSTSEILGRVLPASGIAVERLSDLNTAVDRLRQQRFDALIIDFEDPKSAAEVLEQARRLNSENAPVTVALVAERTKTRDILSSGAHFVLYKPLSDDTTRAGLRAVIALLNRERRRAYRVPVQVPVELTLSDGGKAEGILLDLSEMGMDVLTAEPQVPGALLNFRFQLPDGSLEVNTHGQVVWANPNGQTGVHFLDLEQSIKAQLQLWLQAAAGTHSRPEESVSHCKLTDLSLGGCYVETDSPFPEQALVELCLGVEFPSRTPEQRLEVGNLISLLRSCPESMLEFSVSPRALTADLSQFGPAPELPDETVEDLTSEDPTMECLEDPLLELLQQGSTLQQEDFLDRLRRQRSGESVVT